MRRGDGIANVSLGFGPLATTRKACPPPIPEVERRYLAALAQVRSGELAGDELKLHHLDGERGATLSFARSQAGADRGGKEDR